MDPRPLCYSSSLSFYGQRTSAEDDEKKYEELFDAAYEVAKKTSLKCDLDSITKARKTVRSQTDFPNINLGDQSEPPLDKSELSSEKLPEWLVDFFKKSSALAFGKEVLKLQACSGTTCSGLGGAFCDVERKIVYIDIKMLKTE